MQKPRVASRARRFASDYTRSPLAGAADAADAADDIGEGLLAGPGQRLAPALRPMAGQRIPFKGSRGAGHYGSLRCANRAGDAAVRRISARIRHKTASAAPAHPSPDGSAI